MGSDYYADDNNNYAMDEYYDDDIDYNQYDNLYDDEDEDMDSLYYSDIDYDDDDEDAYDAYDDDFNIEDYADIIDQIDDPTLLQFIFEFGGHHHDDIEEDHELIGDSPDEQACAKANDKDNNGFIDEHEMIGFLQCLKGAAGGYDGPDADKTVSAQEMKCGMAVDKNHNGKIDKEEMDAFEACLG